MRKKPRLRVPNLTLPRCPLPSFDVLAEDLAVAVVVRDLVELAVVARDLDLVDGEAALVR